MDRRRSEPLPGRAVARADRRLADHPGRGPGARGADGRQPADARPGLPGERHVREQRRHRRQLDVGRVRSRDGGTARGGDGSSLSLGAESRPSRTPVATVRSRERTGRSGGPPRFAGPGLRSSRRGEALGRRWGSASPGAAHGIASAHSRPPERTRLEVSTSQLVEPGHGARSCCQRRTGAGEDSIRRGRVCVPPGSDAFRRSMTSLIGQRSADEQRREPGEPAGAVGRGRRHRDARCRRRR